MKLRFGYFLTLAGAMGCATAALGAPVQPLDPQHLWLFDNLVDNDGAGPNQNVNAVPDVGASLTPINLYSAAVTGSTPSSAATREAAKPVQLVNNGTVVENVYSDSGPPYDEVTYYTMGPTSEVFAYPGNKSTLVDFSKVPPVWGNYPDRRLLTTSNSAELSSLSAGDLIGAKGSISFWIQPIRHNGMGFGQFFSFSQGSKVFRMSGNPYGNDDSLGLKVDGGRVETLGTGATGDMDITTQNYPSPPGTVDLDSAVVAFDQNDIQIADPYAVYPTDTTGVNFFGWGDDFNTGTAINGTPSGTWTNFILTWDTPAMGSQGTMKVYKNGDLYFTSSMAIPSTFKPSSFKIGGNSGNDFPFAGLYDEFAIWDTVLTQDEIDWIQLNSLSLNPVPEPASAALLALGLLGLARMGRKRL